MKLHDTYKELLLNRATDIHEKRKNECQHEWRAVSLPFLIRFFVWADEICIKCQKTKSQGTSAGEV